MMLSILMGKKKVNSLTMKTLTRVRHKVIKSTDPNKKSGLQKMQVYPACVSEVLSINKIEVSSVSRGLNESKPRGH